MTTQNQLSVGRDKADLAVATVYESSGLAHEEAVARGKELLTALSGFDGKDVDAGILAIAVKLAADGWRHGAISNPEDRRASTQLEYLKEATELTKIVRRLGDNPDLDVIVKAKTNVRVTDTEAGSVQAVAYNTVSIGGPERTARRVDKEIRLIGDQIRANGPGQTDWDAYFQSRGLE